MSNIFYQAFYLINNFSNIPINTITDYADQEYIFV